MSCNRILTGIVTAAAYCVAWLPMWLLHGLSSALSRVAYWLKLYRYKVIDGNLRRAMPELSDKERRRVIRLFYRHLIDMMGETLKLLTMSDAEIDRRVTVEGAGQMAADVDAGRNIILMLGHYGNWEWCPAITRHYTKPEVSAQIYRPTRDGVTLPVLEKIRNRFGALNVSQHDAFRTLLRLTRSGRSWICAFIADQRPNSSNLNHWITFMGLDTPYSPGGEEIGRRVNGAYYFLDVRMRRRGYYHLTFRRIEPAAEGDYPYMESFMRMLEDEIRRQPELWLWSHKRWSKSRPQSN